MNSFILAIVVLNAMMMATCSNSWCHEKCQAIKQRNYPDNFNIYLEYRRAVLKVPIVRNPPSGRVFRFSNGEIIPGMLNYDTQRHTFFWKRKVRGIVAKSNGEFWTETDLLPIPFTNITVRQVQNSIVYTGCCLTHWRNNLKTFSSNQK